MKKVFFAILAAGMLSSFGGAAYADDQSDISVGGRITPASCDIDIAGGGTFDYGNLTPADLNPTSQKVMSRLTKAVTVQCGSPTTIALSLTDHRANSRAGTYIAVPMIGGSEDIYNGNRYGLGFDGAGKGIGGYAAFLGTASADGKTVVGLISRNGGTSWAAETRGWFGASDNGDAGSLRAWKATTAASNAPMAITNLTVDLNVAAIVQGTQGLTNDFDFDGQSTLSLSYL
ncbi:DUF1120 domain-containing protein [Pandoraea sputorum]|uniref:DUF1120 domain-containing protein n=1 Tax=Pandoraea sputorum TaxID=93222 RepID=A0A5E5AR96_9BURK|nr:DUF1120 domain-containing protein [Pandoraea sputorum]VVE75818.1 hypothetical protein PSP31121_00608 [Pandoraea sputorum]